MASMRVVGFALAGMKNVGLIVMGLAVSVAGGAWAQDGSSIWRVQNAHWSAHSENSGLRITTREGASLAISLAEVRRGGKRLSTSKPHTLTRDAERWELEHGPFRELWTTRVDGAEQHFRFDRAPEGRGPLVLKLSARGARYATTGLEGLRFVGPSGATIRYGHGTWISASGQRTSIPAVWTGSGIELRVPEALLDPRAFPAVLDPLVGPEVTLDSPALNGAAGDQSSPASAFNGTVALVVWNDTRNAPYAARVSTAGALLDARGIRLPAGATNFSVASDGSGFLVVGLNASNAVVGARISGSGVLLDAAWVAISGGVATANSTPSVAFDGTRYLVAWSDTRGGRDAYARFVDTSGAPSGAEFLLVRGTSTELSTAQDKVSLAYGGGTYLAVWDDARNSGSTVFGALVSPAGVVASDVNFPLRASAAVAAGNPQAVFNTGTNEFLAVWENSFASSVEAQRVSLAGTLLGTRISVADMMAATVRKPDVTCNGTDFFVAWADSRSGDSDVYGGRITAAGARVGDVIIAAPGGGMPQSAPALISMGSQYLAVWQDARSGSFDIVGTRFDGLVARLDPSDLIVSQGTNLQRAPQAAWDGTNWLVVWSDWRSGQGDIRAARVSGAGTSLDVNGISIAATANVEDNPDVTFDGVSFLVVWEDRGPACPQGGCTAPVHIWGRRVGLSGAPLTTSFAITSGTSSQQHPRAAGFGGTSLVVWSDSRNQVLGGLDIVGTRVSAGTVLDAPALDLCAVAGDQTQPTVVANSSGFFAVWADQRTGGNAATKLIGTRVTTSGGVSDPAGLVISDVVLRQPSEPDLATDGTTYLAAWSSNSPGGQSVFVRGINASGGLLGSGDLKVANLNTDQRDVSLAYDGPWYFVVWRDFRVAPENSDLMAVRVQANAVLPSDGTGIAIAASVDPEFAPSVAAGTSGRLLIAYGRRDGDPLYDTERVRARRVARAVQGASCADPLECASGFCVDGVCCDTACGGTTNADCQACAASSGASADGVCTTRGSTATCRASTGVCDPAELCDGASVTCPANVFVPSSTECRASTGVCDPAERCTGSSGPCPGNVISPSGTTCRPAAGDCDQEERCDGASSLCPADQVRGALALCRASQGACDAPERCSGTSTQCPLDLFQDAGVGCRNAITLCDVAEVCTGTDPQCPADGFAPPSRACRPAATDCDVEELCTGSSAACPADGLLPNGTACVDGVCWSGSCLDPDAGLPDAGPPDAGSTEDAGIDAGARDAGPSDAGIRDAGTPDAGIPDAGRAPSDAGQGESLPPDGCGCQSRSGGPWMLMWLFAAWALMRARALQGPTR